MIAFLVLPRRYQAEAILHVGVSYFRNPLISDLVSQTHDPGELRSERARLVKSSLGVEFANKMGEKFKIFSSAPGTPQRNSEIEGFLKRLDVADVTATQFQIKFKAKNPEVAYGIIQGALAEIRDTMFEQRVAMLEQLLGVLDNEIHSSGDASGRGALPSPGTKPEIARAQVSAQVQILEKRLEDLLKTYNEAHPTIQGIKAELAELKSFEATGNINPGLTRRKVFRRGGEGGVTTIRDDLTKQKHLVNMALEMERKDPSMSTYLSLTKEPVFPERPIFPQLRLFLIFALVTGVIAATAVAAAREFWQGISMPPAELARELNIELLGTLSLRG
jgi:hypothetical protein